MSFLNEIGQQPDILARLTSTPRDDVVATAGIIRTRAPEFILIAARGTSDNAARYAKYVFGVRNNLPVALAAPSILGIYNSHLRLDRAVAIAISQSGQSTDLIRVLEQANDQGCPTIAMTNDATSPLAKAANQVIDIRAGHEASVAASKTYTAQLATVACLSAQLAEASRDELKLLPAKVSAVLEMNENIARMVDDFVLSDRAAVIGRGFQLSTAFEWALKIEELAQMTAHPYSVADFLHGPIAAIGPGLPVLAVATSGPAYDQCASVVGALAEERLAKTLMISDGPAAPGTHHIRVPDTDEWLAPIPSIVAAQLFVHHLVRAKKLDPDAPRGLVKATRTL